MKTNYSVMVDGDFVIGGLTALQAERVAADMRLGTPTSRDIRIVFPGGNVPR